MGIDPESMLFIGPQCSIVETAIRVSDPTWALHHILSKHASVFERTLHQQHAVTIEVVVHEGTFIDLFSIRSYASASDDFIIKEFTFITCPISSLEHSSPGGPTSCELPLVVVATRPCHPSTTFPHTIHQLTLVRPPRLILDLLMTGEAGEASRGLQGRGLLDSCFDLCLLAGLVCLFGRVGEGDYLAFIVCGCLRRAVCGDSIAILADGTISHLI